MHMMDNTLLSHEATGEDLWMAVMRHNWCDDNMANVVRLEYILYKDIHPI